jgi:hypothetical protein
MFIKLICHWTVFILKKLKAAPSPVPSTPKVGNYDQYHEILDQHKQQMVDGERNMDNWNKSIDIDIKNLF